MGQLRFSEITRQDERGAFFEGMRNFTAVIPPSSVNSYTKLYGAYHGKQLAGGYIFSTLREPWHLGLIPDHIRTSDPALRFDPTQSLEISGIWLERDHQTPQNWYDLTKNMATRGFMKRKERVITVIEKQSFICQMLHSTAKPRRVFVGRLQPMAGTDTSPFIEILQTKRWNLLLGLPGQRKFFRSHTAANLQPE